MIIETMLILALCALLFLMFFHRDPKRRIPSSGILVAPADGKILTVTDLTTIKPTLIKKGMWGKITADIKKPESKMLVSIFMSPLDVHILRSPCAGTVVSVKHKAGGFVKAYSLDALENERTEVIIKNPKLGNIYVYFIAGFLARRVVTWVRTGQELRKGQKVGYITLGSQTSIVMDKTNLNLKKGERVKGGINVFL